MPAARWRPAVRVACLLAVLALGSPGPARAAVPGAAGDSVRVPILLVVSGTDATIEALPAAGAFRVRMSGDSATWFTDRPARRTGTMPAAGLAREWPRVFGADPPNAALLVRIEGQLRTYVVEATAFRAARGVIAFTARPLAGATSVLPARGGEVDLFIDDAQADVPVDPADQPASPAGSPVWVYHSLVIPRETGPSVGRITLNPGGQPVAPDLVYSLPASSLAAPGN